MTSDDRSATVRRYVAMARRRLPILIAATVLVPLAAIGFSLAQQQKFAASSTVLLSRQSVANLLTGTADPGNQQQSFQQIRTTQARLARTDAVVRDALQLAGASGTSVPRFLAQSDATANPDNDLLIFRVVDADPRAAARLASAYATAFVAYRRQLDTTSLDLALREVESARAAATAGTGDRDMSKLTSSLGSKEQQLQTLRALQASNAQVVDASDRTTRVQPRTARNAVVGLFFGVLLGFGLAAVRDMLDARVRSEDEIGELLRIPILARVGTPPQRPDGTPQLAMIEEPNGLRAESFRILRMKLRFVTLDRTAHVLMVSSAAQAEGKSTTIANLAVAMARAGESVVVVDLDLRKPTVARLFGLDGRLGLTNVVLGDTSLDAAVATVALDTPGAAPADAKALAVLPSGPLPPEPAEFINSRALANLITRLRERFDVVLIDAPPLIHLSDTMILAGHADGLFVCTRLGTISRPVLRELRRVLDVVKIDALGYVITGAEADESGAYGYGYGYGYGVAANGHQHAPVTAPHV